MSTNNQFASASLTAGQLNAMVKKLGGEEGALRFLRGDATVSVPPQRWLEKDGVIYFWVTSNGMSGKEWITYFEKKGVVLGYKAKEILSSADFTPTKDTPNKIAVLKSMLISGSRESGNSKSVYTSDFLSFAKFKKLLEPNIELACLIRDMFSDEEIEAMGLDKIAVGHKECQGISTLLCVSRRFGKGNSLEGYVPSCLGTNGMAFIVP